MGVLCSLCGRPLEGKTKSKDYEQQYMVMTRRDSSLHDSNRSLMNKPTTVYSLCNDTEEMEHLLLGISNCNNDSEADGPGPPP